LPSYARVTNLRNAHSIIVRVNDRGPYHGGRVMDVSERVAEALDFRSTGTARVKVEWMGRAELSGSDTNKLLASLRTDGEPATLEGFGSNVMVAEREAPVRTAYNEPPRRDSVDGGEGAVRSYASASEPQARSGQDEMTALVKSVGDESDNVGAISSKARSRSSGALAPLPPTRPFDLGAAATKKSLKEASN
jgi:rare lipoprotein A